MKIMMQNRLTAFSQPGGDTIQMLKTREYLINIGLTVDISLDKSQNFDGYDLVHIFNMQDIAVTHSYHQVLNAKRQSKPVVLSTIYWDFSEVYMSKNKIENEIGKYNKKSTFRRKVNTLLGKSIGIEIIRLSRLESLLREAKQEARQKENKDLIKSQQISCLLLSDALLPNSQAELDLLNKDFGVSLNKAYIIPNAADSIFLHSDGTEFTNKYGISNFILCVGRIEHIKNQLLLIRAMKGSGLPLVIIGSPGWQAYFKQCLDEADTNTIFLDHMLHNELRSAYGAAKVHVLPSWRETPGLVNLEAGLAGCNIVVTNRGSTEEYFGHYAYYCEPNDIASIKKAVLKAYDAPKNPKLAQHIFENFTWEKVAKKTLAAYKAILQS